MKRRDVRRCLHHAVALWCLLAVVYARAIYADEDTRKTQYLSAAGRQAWAATVFAEVGMAMDLPGGQRTTVWARADGASTPVTGPPVLGPWELWSLAGLTLSDAGSSASHITPGLRIEPPRPEGIARLIALDRNAQAAGDTVGGLLAPTAFLKPGRTLLYCFGGHRPWDGTLCLDSEGRSPAPYAGTPAGLRPLRTEEDLIGEVSIASPDDALAYARLFTTAALVPFGSDGGDWSEIRPEGDISGALVFGIDTGLTQRVPTHAELARWSGMYGLILDDAWATAGLFRPAVATATDAYLVVRWLCRIPSMSMRGSSRAYRVAEAISRDGVVYRDVLEERDLGQGVSFMYPPPRDIGASY